MTTTTVTAKRAATGPLTGLALGDALGFPTEFNDVPSILAKCGPWREMELPRPAIVTDDTQMTLALGKGLRTAMDGAASSRPRRWRSPYGRSSSPGTGRRENNRAPGTPALTACDLLERPDRPGRTPPRSTGRCGANMRVAPVGLAPGLSDEQRAGAAQLRPRSPTGTPPRSPPSTSPHTPCGCSPRERSRRGLVGLPWSYAYDNRTRYHERWLGDLWTRAQDSTPEHFIARRAGTSAWRYSTGSRRRRAPVSPETDPWPAVGEGWIAEEAMAAGLLCLPALRRRAADRPVRQRRLHRRRLRLHRSAPRAPSRRSPGRRRLARRGG
ncbi:ADP-ribosylglycohydrolase family protein [Streptomyces thinghirensis]|nr:ADP-ribosylglycohydrolase family protein [Streptomyces thinghirensis]